MPIRSDSLRNFLLIFAAALTLILWRNHAFYFSNPYHEEGDIALNALQINRAKSFGEIYGNYSRFHFNHPGPAFFYVYAAAEIVICDWLAADVTPHGSHSIAGTAIQCAFFALALTIAASLAGLRLFLPLALLAAAVHYSMAGHAFWSIWPPHVLLMPFLAFWMACLSVACGRGGHVIWAVLSGSFLVHGHVAQPMFVAGVFLVAWIVLWRRLRESGGERSNPLKAFPRTHWTAAVVIAIFLLPIAIDVSRGAESNVTEIIRHMRYSGEEHKTLLRALMYFVSFFGYMHDQDEALKPSWPGFLEPFGANWPIFAAWLVPAVILLWAVRGRFPSLGGQTRELLAAGARLWFATAALCVVWGTMQAGPMFEFNGYFFFSIVYVVLLGLAVVIAALLDKPARDWWTAPLVLVMAAGFAVRGISAPNPGTSSSGAAVLLATQAALKADPNPDLPKLLTFAHDDWPAVASVALALKRMDRRFYTERSWEFMFQSDHTVPDDILREPVPEVSVWRFVNNPESEEGVKIARNLRVNFEPAPLSPKNGVIDFSKSGNLEKYLATGFSMRDDQFGWTGEPVALLQFKAEKADQDVALEMIAEPFLKKGQIDRQPTVMHINGYLVFSAPFHEPGVLRARVPRDVWNKSPIGSIHMHLPNARSPSDLGLSGDVRVFGLAVRKLTTRPADPLP